MTEQTNGTDCQCDFCKNHICDVNGHRCMNSRCKNNSKSGDSLIRKPIKYLCICDYGQVRSVAMAWYIHGLNRNPTKKRIDKLQYEAIPIGSVTSSKKTMKMMKQWADVIIDVRKWTEDNYGTPTHPELTELCKRIWEEIHTK